MTISKRYKRQPIHFEVIPIIDVLFTLLIFFVIYASTVAGLSNKGIKMKLPVATSVVKEVKGILVSIDENSEIFIDGVAVSPDMFRQEITTRINGATDMSIILSADKIVSYDRVITVLDDIRLAGGVNVSLKATQKAETVHEKKG